MISILILTKNEEKDLPGCLESVSWSDDIHVYDSLSTDNTISIAENFGAKVTSRPFDNWASHQNWGLRNISFKYPWVFYIDADERMTPTLVRNVQNAVKASGAIEAFRVQRRDYFLETWLKHVQTSPFYIRLFRPEKLHYERLVNPISIVEGQIGHLNGYLDHFPFSKGLSHWIERHNSYSSLEAKEFLNARMKSSFSLRTALFERDFNTRRVHQKELFYKLPLRPFVKFCALYFIKRGFMDGRAGFRYAVLQSIYEYFIALKVDEIQRSAKSSKS